MRCEDLMKSTVECVLPQDTAQNAACKMRDSNIGFLPVCDEQNKVLGTLTDRDLAIRLIADAKAANTTVQDLMTEEVVACRPDDDISACEDLMARHHKSRVMCVDDAGKLVGVISLSDIARHDASNAPRIMQEVSEREVTAH